MNRQHIRITSPFGLIGAICCRPRYIGLQQSTRRWQSSISTASAEVSKGPVTKFNSREHLPPLSVMPTGLLLRTFIVTSLLSSPRLLDMCLPLMDRMSRTSYWLLNPDKNPLLHKVVRLMFYDHFAAGENAAEVKQTVAEMKGIGFKGVIIGYAKECLIPKSEGAESSTSEIVFLTSDKAAERTLEEWREGNLETIKMIEPGDFLAIKFTGAGPLVTDALKAGLPPPPALWSSMLTISNAAAARGIRFWIDAEQQVFQKTIDAWALELMRQYNRGSRVLVYNTFQAYLKSTSERLKQFLLLAQKEDWALGIKLVRGAYIATEPRHLIHDTKADTDRAYDSIAASLLHRDWAGLPSGKDFPRTALFIAGHNDESVKSAYSIYRSRVLAGEEITPIEFGQLQGMADEISCGLIQIGRSLRAEEQMSEDMKERLTPKVFKCLCWGGVQECMQFLLRRAVENKGAVERTKQWREGLKRELMRRAKVSS